MTPQEARARELAALGVGHRGIAAETGLSRRQVAKVLAELAPPAPPPPARVAPEPPAPAWTSPVDPPTAQVELPELPDLEPPPPAPRRTTPAPRRTPAPTPPAKSPALLAKEARDRAYEAACERARLAVEAHGYRDAAPSHAPPLPASATLDDARRALRSATGGRVL